MLRIVNSWKKKSGTFSLQIMKHDEKDKCQGSDETLMNGFLFENF